MAKSRIEERGYAHPEALVSTDWVAERIQEGDALDPTILLIESNEDPLLYPSGHIPGAVEVDWTRDLNDPVRRDYLDREGFERLARRIGLAPETTAVFYGDRNNWWATYAFWVFQLFGHQNARVMDGGRIKWLAEERPMTREVPEREASSYRAKERDDRTERVFRRGVVQHVETGGQLVDVRSPQEFSGERLHMPDYPNEGALRGGHIPGASNIPWATAIDEDGTFKDSETLRAIYSRDHGITGDRPVITYCRIGERSSHTWFVLKYLLGMENVRNYDGSWTEWGNLVGVPIAKDV